MRTLVTLLLPCPELYCLAYRGSLAFIHDIKTSGLGSHLVAARNDNNQPHLPLIQRQHRLPEPPMADSLLQSFARQSLTTLTSALQKMDHYWAGIAYVMEVMEMKTRSAGLQSRIGSDSNSEIGTGEESNRSIASLRARRTFITLPDQGLLHRFTGKRFSLPRQGMCEGVFM